MEQATTTAARWSTTMKKTSSLLILLGLMLVTLLAAAATAFAQQQPPPAPQVEPPVTGVLEETGLGDTPGYEDPTYGLLDESSGVLIVLESTVYDLSAYLGERVTADGTLTPANPPGAGFPVLDVTSLELAGPPETATVTFQLTIDGAVPEGRTFGLGYRPIGYLNRDFQSVSFCTTDTEDPDPAPQGAPPDFPDESTLPVCEDGSTYTDTLEVPLGEPFSFDYLVNADRDDVQCDPGRMGPLEVFYSETRTFTEDATVSATYTEDGLPPGCRAVGEDDSGSGNDGEGSDGGRRIVGTDGPDELPGTTGDDTVIGGYGDDLLQGFDGADLLVAEAGADRVEGGPGNDALYAAYVPWETAPDAPASPDLLYGGEGDDFIDAADAAGAADAVYCGPGDDLVVAEAEDFVADDCEEIHRFYSGLHND